MKRLMRDERGSSPYLVLAGLIVAPIIMLAIVGASVSATRTGAGLTDALTRGALVQTMLDDFTATIASATTIHIDSATRITATMDPADLPAGIAVAPGSVGETCVTTTWELVATGDLVSLAKTYAIHQGDCASPVDEQTDTEFTGLKPGAAFSYANAGLRELEVIAGELVPAAGDVPAGVSAGTWSSTTPSVVRLNATMQEMFGDREITATAFPPQR